jgi:hypothetical protein
MRLTPRVRAVPYFGHPLQVSVDDVRSLGGSSAPDVDPDCAALTLRLRHDLHEVHTDLQPSDQPDRIVHPASL